MVRHYAASLSFEKALSADHIIGNLFHLQRVSMERNTPNRNGPMVLELPTYNTARNRGVMLKDVLPSVM